MHSRVKLKSSPSLSGQFKEAAFEFKHEKTSKMIKALDTATLGTTSAREWITTLQNDRGGWGSSSYI